MKLNNCDDFSPVQRLFVNYLWELYEIERNYEIRKNIEKESESYKIDEIFYHTSLNSLFSYRISWDFGSYQYVLLEIANDKDIIREVKDEIFKIYSNDLITGFKDLSKTNGLPKKFPHAKENIFVSEEDPKSLLIESEKENRKIFEVLQFMLDEAHRLNFPGYIIPIKTLIHKYVNGSGTDYLLFNSRFPIYDLENSESYEISRVSKSHHENKKINSLFQNVRFPVRYLKENSEDKEFLAQYYRSFTVIPNNLKEELYDLLKIMLDINTKKIESVNPFGKTNVLSLFLKESVRIGMDKWFAKKSVKNKIQILNGFHSIQIDDEAISCRYNSLDDFFIFNEALFLIKKHYFYEANYPLRYLQKNTKDIRIKSLSTLWLDFLDLLFNFANKTKIEKFKSSFDCCSNLGLKNDIKEIIHYKESLEYLDFWNYGSVQTKLFQFESAKKVHNVHSSEQLSSKNELALNEYFLGNVDEALKLFEEINKKAIESNKTSIFFLISAIFRSSIYYEKNMKIDGYNSIIEAINHLNTTNQINGDNIFHIFNITVRGLLKSCELPEIIVLCENLGHKLESYGVDKYMVNFYIGLALDDHSCLDESIIFYNRALPETDNKIKKGNVKVRIADIYSRKGDFVTSEKYYNKLLLIEPNNAEIYYIRALNHAAMNEYSYAKNMIKHAVNLDKKNQQYKELLKLYEKLSFNEGIYLWRIKDNNVRALFEQANYKIKNNSPDEKTFSDVISLYGSGLEQFLKVNVAFPLRKKIKNNLKNTTDNNFKTDYDNLKTNSSLKWIYELIQYSNMELGNWGYINKKLTESKKNSVTKFTGNYLNEIFKTNDPFNPIPIDLNNSIDLVRKKRNTAAHGKNFTKEEFEKTNKSIINSINNVIMRFC